MPTFIKIRQNSSAKAIILEMNDYAIPLKAKNYLLNKIDVKRVVERIEFVEVWIDGLPEPFIFTFENPANANKALVIESIEGVKPISLNDLFLKIEAIKNNQ
jgi:hypothetical protein